MESLDFPHPTDLNIQYQLSHISAAFHRFMTQSRIFLHKWIQLGYYVLFLALISCIQGNIFICDHFQGEWEIYSRGQRPLRTF